MPNNGSCDGILFFNFCFSDRGGRQIISVVKYKIYMTGESGLIKSSDLEDEHL
jgi:hypothetical protein